jgi:hypothetical protein
MGRRVQLPMRWQWSPSTSVLNLGTKGENKANSREGNLGNNDIVPLWI